MEEGKRRRREGRRGREKGRGEEREKGEGGRRKEVGVRDGNRRGKGEGYFFKIIINRYWHFCFSIY